MGVVEEGSNGESSQLSSQSYLCRLLYVTILKLTERIKPIRAETRSYLDSSRGSLMNSSTRLNGYWRSSAETSGSVLRTFHACTVASVQDAGN